MWPSTGLRGDSKTYLWVGGPTTRMAGRAGSNGIRNAPLLAVGVGLLFVLAVLVPAASPVAAQEEDAVLYLTERPFEDFFERWNFTAIAPDVNETERDRRADQANVPDFAAGWNWFLPRTPENWSVEEGTEWEFVFFIEGLDEVHPLPMTLFPPSTNPGSYEIIVEVFDSDGVHASGSSLISLLEVEAGIQSYSATASFHEDKTFETGEGSGELNIEISISGRGNDPESPLFIHFGSDEYPSRLSVPDYPHAAFREMELDFLAGQECKELLLQQESCKALAQDDKDPENGGPNGNETDGEEPNPRNGNGGENQTEPETRGSPGPGVVPFISGALILLSLIHRGQIHRRKGDNE